MNVLRSIALGVGLATAGVAVSGAFLAENLFPTSVGSTWSYSSVMPGQPGPINQTVTVTSAKKSGSTTTAVFLYRQGGTSTQEETYLVTPSAVSRVKSGAGGVNVISPPLPVIKYPMKVGKTWNWTGSIAMPNGKFNGKAVLKVLNRGKINTPAKAFDAYEVQLKLTVTGGGGSANFINSYWFSPGVGLVKQSLTINGNTIDGSLSSYKIK